MYLTAWYNKFNNRKISRAPWLVGASEAELLSVGSCFPASKTVQRQKSYSRTSEICVKHQKKYCSTSELALSCVGILVDAETQNIATLDCFGSSNTAQGQRLSTKPGLSNTVINYSSNLVRDWMFLSSVNCVYTSVR